MNRRWALGIAVVLVAVLVVALASRHRAPGPPPAPHGAALQVAFGRTRILPPALFGINGEAIIGPGVWSNPGFLSALAALRPQAIRVFGGTPANFWDWRTGTYVRSRRIPSTLGALRDHVHVTLVDWARVVGAGGATPVFDLNMFTSDLRSQLTMLHAARRLGMPVRYIELGNELYLPQYAIRFHSGRAYARVASRWIAAIKRAFPGVAIAADAYPGRDSNSGTVDRRELRWNAELLGTLRGESALSLHAYFTSGLAPRDSLASPAMAERMLGAPARRWAALAHLIAQLPAKVKIWVTEWNLFDTVARVHGTWAQGLAVAAFGIELLSAPRVAESDYETLVNSAPFGAIFGDTAGLQLSSGGGRASETFRAVVAHAPATPLFGLAAGGVAMRALLAGLVGARFSRTMVFGPAAVRGIAFAGGLGIGAVIVNLSGRPFVIAVPALLRGLPYTERSAKPITLVAGTASLRNATGNTSATLELQPFSLIRIGKAR